VRQWETSLSQASILIVDDDSKSLLALQQLLQSVTQEVVVANSVRKLCDAS